MAEAQAAYSKLLAGNRSGKFINPAQQLLDFLEANQECSRSMRLIEKMHEALRKGEKSLGAEMWAYSGGADAPCDVFDFRVSRHRDGPAEFLTNYSGHVMADCYSGNVWDLGKKGGLVSVKIRSVVDE